MAPISLSVSDSEFGCVEDPAGPLTPKAAANLKNRAGFKLYFILCIQVQPSPGSSENMQG